MKHPVKAKKTTCTQLGMPETHYEGNYRRAVEQKLLALNWKRMKHPVKTKKLIALNWVITEGQ